MRRLPILAAIAILLVSFSGSAEPGPTITWLMGQPMTLWDWGIFQLEKRAERTSLFIQNTDPQIQALYSGAFYVFGENRIEIKFIMFKEDTTYRDIEETCLVEWNLLLDDLLKISTADDRESRAIEVLEDSFRHAGGYKIENRPLDVGRRLSRVSFLSLSLVVKDEQKIECIGRLVDEEPRYRRNPAQ